MLYSEQDEEESEEGAEDENDSEVAKINVPSASKPTSKNAKRNNTGK